MKRFFCMLLALLCLWTVLPSRALRGPVEVPHAMEASSYVLGACVYQGALLIRTSDGLYRYREDEQAQLLEALPEPLLGETPNFALLLSEGKQLYGLDPLPGLLYPLSLEDGLSLGQPHRLHLEDYTYADGLLAYITPPHQALIHGGRLYLLFDTTPGGAQESTLLSFNLNGQDRRDHRIDHLRAIAPYKEDSLLCLVEAQPGTLAPGALQVFHPADGSLTAPQPLNENYHFGSDGLLWDAENNLIYYHSQDKLYARDSAGQETLCAHLGDAYAAGPGLLLRPGLVAFPHPKGVSVRQTVPPQLESLTLTIRGDYADDQHQRAARLMPDVRIEFEENWSLADSLSEALVVADAGFDLYAVSPEQMDLRSLMAKGYALPLKESMAIREHMQRLPEQVRNAATQEDVPCLLPFSIRLHPLYANLPLFEEAGLKVPRSLEELVSLMAQPPEDPPLFEFPLTREELMHMACRLWTARALRQEEQPVFSHPDFLRVMKAIRQVPMIPAPPEDMPPSQALMPMGNHLQLDIWTNTRAWGRTMEPVFLSFLTGEDPLPLMQAQMLAVNPRSPRQGAALQYLESRALSLSALERAALYPRDQAPLEDPAWPRRQMRAKAALAALEKQAAQMQGAEKTEAERQVQAFKDSLSQGGDKNRWLVTEDVLQQYQQLLAAAVLEDHRFTLVLEAGADTVFRRALQGSLSFEQAARELDERLALMRAERQ